MPATKATRVAAVARSLDWSHRTITSHERFDLDVAKRYMERHVAVSLRLMEEAALLGADLVVGPEYFEGSELFTVDDVRRRQFVERVEESGTIGRLRALSKKRGVYLACSFNLYHGDLCVQTGVLTGRDGELVGTQIKHTALSEGAEREHAYSLFGLDFGRAGIFTCSDLNTYPEDGIRMAKQGMQIAIVPGCGFGPEPYLVTKAADFGCVLVHADGGRGMIVNSKGKVVAITRTPNSIVYADVEIPQKEPAERLRWGVN